MISQCCGQPCSQLFMDSYGYQNTHHHMSASSNQPTLSAFEDIHINSTTVTLHVKASKTDPFRQGTSIQIFRNNSPLCAVRALTAYLQARSRTPGPLFTWSDGRYLTRSGLNNILTRIKPQYISSMSSHSFRIGAATTAAAAGYPRWLIQALGRWSSNCYRDYIRIPHSTLQNVSISLSQNHIITQPPFDPDNIS